MFIPFNHKPVDAFVEVSGTYTVPAGKFARVVGLSYDMEIDTVVFGEQVATGNTTGTGDIITSAGSDAPCVLEISKTGVNSATFVVKDGAGNTIATITLNGNTGKTLRLPPAVAYTVNISTNANANSCTATIKSDRALGREFWVKAGQVVDGSRFTVEEYSDYV